MSSEFMLCSPIEEGEFEKMELDGFVVERKFDGEHLIVIKEGKNINIYNRANREKSKIYFEIVSEVSLKTIKDFVVVGEVIAGNSFNSLQHRSNLSNDKKIKEVAKKYPIKLMVFDCISYDRENISNLPLIERKKYLENFRDLETIEVVNYFEGEDIKKFWNWIKEQGYEGIILKPKNSKYLFGNRGIWKKIKTWQFAEIVFYKFDENNNGSITVYNEKDRCLVSGKDVEIVKKEINENGKVDLEIRYLEKTKENKYRFIHYNKIK